MECKHKYKTIEIQEGTEKFLLFRKYKMRIYILECSKCGLINRRVIELPLDSSNTKEAKVRE